MNHINVTACTIVSIAQGSWETCNGGPPVTVSQSRALPQPSKPKANTNTTWRWHAQDSASHKISSPIIHSSDLLSTVPSLFWESSLILQVHHLEQSIFINPRSEGHLANTSCTEERWLKDHPVIVAPYTEIRTVSLALLPWTLGDLSPDRYHSGY